ncbi:BamA/TamA family outer membrane protein [Algoriphagus halophilus]|uniref:Surface antigen n=1 Tax=Algoriphagus halophilus TaxID=226505 RepID=A0A1N6DQZ5_9BACT|nr:BamA/TamA family outer membrane protein [Algoriphagus halophilus]SIN73196.1 Surface antigen [Algoriphagus halophilus]
MIKSIIVGLMVCLVMGGYSLKAIGQTDTLPKKKEKKKISFRDPEDGAFDVSEFLISPTGFFPIPIIITEPAVGYGGGASILFFQPHKGKGGDKVAPNITGVAGLVTQNKTWLAGAFHRHVFGDNRVISTTAVAKPDIFIKYFGNNNEFLSRNPITMNLDSWVAHQGVKVRLGDSKFFAGLNYTFFRTEVSLDTIPGRPLLNLILNRLKGTSTISTIQPKINWDKRDNIFTPTKGFDTGVSFTYNAEWLGADETFYSLNTYFKGYFPIASKLYSSWRFDGKFLLGEAPLYAYPFIQLRGIPAMRFQSDNTLVVESEWRYEVFRRWSVLGFVGGGKAINSLENFKDFEWAYSGGTGIRYKIAKIFGAHSGVDFAWGSAGDFAFYIVFGTSI